MRARLTRAGVPERRRGRPVQIEMLADQDWLRRQYVQQHRSAADIARELACSETAVLDALRRHRLPVRDRGGGNRRRPMPPELKDVEWLEQRYWREGASIRQIAVQLNVSGSAVANALRRTAVKRRPVGNQSAPPPLQPRAVPSRRTAGPQPIGLLQDGTEYVAQLGKLDFVDGGRRVVCHLCGKSFRLLSTSHLRRHGWTPMDYRLAFGLNRGTPLCASNESARRREIGLERYRNNSRVRDGLARGQELVRSGEALAMAHAAMPPGAARLQRRQQVAAATQAQRDALQSTAAARREARIRELGFRSERAYVKDRYVRRGWGIASIKAELQVGSGAVERILDTAGIERRPPGGRSSGLRRAAERS